jgi:5-formyltetrahydrofolate cyclo-ligase
VHDPTEDLAALKVALRRRMREVRRALEPSARLEAAGRAASLLVGLPEVEAARTVLVFASYGSEISTEPLIGELRTRSRTVLLPFVVEGRMEASAFDPDEPLVATALGPSEPPEPVAVDPSGVDLVVVPGLAFDRNGYRLGFGGGFYDAFLPRLRPDAPRCGLCFDRQLVEAVPHGPADRRVDLVITDREVVDCRPGGAR